MKVLLNLLPHRAREKFLLHFFMLTKIPLLHYIGPEIVEMDNSRTVVKIRLFRRTKNHLNAMYFGVMAAGADMAGGLMAMRLIQKSGQRIDLLFKDFRADFLKRAEGDTLFACQDGAAIQKLVTEAIATGERVNTTVHVTATVPERLGVEPVATFELTLSLRRKARG